MERGAPEPSKSKSKSAARSSHLTISKDAPSRESAADHASRRTHSISLSVATPTTSEFSANPGSARSTTFPDHLHRQQQQQQQQYYPSSNHNGSSGDPSIAASSPTYPPHGPQYSPYPPQQQMTHGYPQHPGGPMYAQPRPDWTGYTDQQQQQQQQQQQHHGIPAPYQTTGVSTPTSAAPAGARPGQVYSFVPIPGAQQHKRPRRRYEEIERMYKCGWNGCEKAYGTLNHLNAHVTMQAHGQKRTPEEFKEIRKEWKQRKKDEDNQRKAEDERARAAAAQSNPSDGPPNEGNPPPPGYPQGARPQVQLPPIGYQPGAQVPGPYQAPPGGVQQLQEYSNNHMYAGYPASPYGAPTPMYNQHNGAAPQPKYDH